MASEAQKAASAKYQASHIKQVKFTLNDRTDQDILRHLQDVSNIQGYLKSLIRKEIKESATQN